MLVGKKTCPSKKIMSLGEFPLPKTDMSRPLEFAVMQERRTAEAGKKRPRAYRGKKREKNSSCEKKRFFVGWKNKMLVGKKTCWLKKKCRLENFPCQKRTCPECPEFPVMQDRKTAEAGKKCPSASKREKKGGKFVVRKKNVFCQLEKQNVGGKKTCRLR